MIAKIKQYPYKANSDKILTYQYSKFSGFGFIESYKSFRLQTLAALKSRIEKGRLKTIIPDYLKNFKFDKTDSEILQKLVTERIINKSSLQLVLYMQYNIQKDKRIKEYIYKWLSILVKKYEVARKIDSNNYKHLEGYILFGTNLAIFYKHSHNLKFLNALLKLNDVLCTINTKVAKNLTPLLYFAINTELEEIKILFNKKGLKI